MNNSLKIEVVSELRKNLYCVEMTEQKVVSCVTSSFFMRNTRLKNAAKISGIRNLLEQKNLRPFSVNRE